MDSIGSDNPLRLHDLFTKDGAFTGQAGAWFYKRNVSALPVILQDGTSVVSARFEALERLPEQGDHEQHPDYACERQWVARVQLGNGC